MQDKARGPLGQWLWETCKEQHLSLREAAVKTGLSHTTLAGLMNGTQPSADTIQKLAQAFTDDGHERLVLEDKLLILAGYRSVRTEEPLREPLARLLDKLSKLGDAELRLMGHFADFISQTEKK